MKVRQVLLTRELTQPLLRHLERPHFQDRLAQGGEVPVVAMDLLAGELLHAVGDVLPDVDQHALLHVLAVQHAHALFVDQRRWWLITSSYCS